MLCACTSSSSIKALCTAADAAGKSLTITGAALKDAIVLQTKMRWEQECKQSDDAARKTCREGVVTSTIAEWKDKYGAVEQAAKAEVDLAQALEQAAVCKETK
jgi:hypothetical protein